MSLGQVVPAPCSRSRSDEFGSRQAEEQSDQPEFNGGDLSDLGWLSQYRPFPTVPRSEESDSVAESVESSIQAQQRFAMASSCLPFNYSIPDAMNTGSNGLATGKPVCRWPKPAFSYSCLIAMALKKSETGQLPVHDIYDFMESNYPYFKTAPDGWKNSVRHNLSLNKWFVKVDTGDKSVKKKGCLWAINEVLRSNIEREISKWSRKNPHAILAAMAKPGQDGPDMPMSTMGAIMDSNVSPASLAMASNANATSTCSGMPMPLTPFSLPFAMAPAAALPPTSTVGMPSAATPGNLSASMASGSGAPSAGMPMASQMMGMPTFPLSMLWPGYGMPVTGAMAMPGGFPMQMPASMGAGGMPLPAGLQMHMAAGHMSFPGAMHMTAAGMVMPAGMAVSMQMQPTSHPAAAATPQSTSAAAHQEGSKSSWRAATSAPPPATSTCTSASPAHTPADAS